MKLVFVALALTAVAFAAPRTNFLENDQVVPEELVQVGEASYVATLKQQFHELQMQVKAGAEVTPGVKDTIEKMIDMVTTKIEPAINDAHAADQENLNTQMEAIATLNDMLESDVADLNQQADNVRKLIDDEQAAAAAWDSAASLFTATQNHYLAVYDNQTDTCCQKDNSAVLDVQYVPAYVECDYTIPAGATCSKRARAAVSAIVTTPFTDGLVLYRKLVGECASLTADLAAADKDTDAKHLDCGRKKLAEKAASELAAKEQARVQKQWDMTISYYNSNYTAMNTKYQKTKAVVKTQEADRKSEWEATQQIKCMLKAYEAGGTFDEATAEGCKEGIEVKLDIGYPVEVQQMFPVLEPFEKQTDTSAYENVCTTRTPAPQYTCVVREPRPYPVCDNHDLA
jgi:hypothetical protein